MSAAISEKYDSENERAQSTTAIIISRPATSVLDPSHSDDEQNAGNSRKFYTRTMRPLQIHLKSFRCVAFHERKREREREKVLLVECINGLKQKGK